MYALARGILRMKSMKREELRVCSRNTRGSRFEECGFKDPGSEVTRGQWSKGPKAVID